MKKGVSDIFIPGKLYEIVKRPNFYAYLNPVKFIERAKKGEKHDLYQLNFDIKKMAPEVRVGTICMYVGEMKLIWTSSPQISDTDKEIATVEHMFLVGNSLFIIPGHRKYVKLKQIE